MKNLLLLTFILIFNINAMSQIKSNYERGFEVGFKEGYCYNNETIDCFYPITPLAPLPRINESKDNYTQGYNRGFQFGLDLKRSNDALGNANSNLNMRVIKFNEYISQNPVNAMVAVGMIKQAKYDARKDWIQNRIDILVELKNNLFNEQTLPSNVNASSTKEAIWKKAVNYVNSISSYDFADDYQFNSIQTNFNKIERSFYESYNEIVSRNSERETLKSSNPAIIGKISFWTNWKRPRSMKVYLDGNYIGTFESYFENVTPICGQKGTITVSRPPGTYSFHAESEGSFSTRTWEGTITVVAGGYSLQGLTKK